MASIQSERKRAFLVTFSRAGEKVTRSPAGADFGLLALTKRGNAFQKATAAYVFFVHGGSNLLMESVPVQIKHNPVPSLLQQP